MHTGAVVALAGVAPVSHIHAAVRAVGQFHAAKPVVCGAEKIWAVFAHIAGASAFEDFLVRTPAVHVQREESAAILGRPVVALVDHHADVSMPTAESVGRAIS